jgi:hypothetical protein
MRVDFSRRNRDDIGAELREFGQHETLYTVTNRGQQNYRCNTDGNTGCR